MAAAYAFHISENQPFHDGNKRTGFVSSLLFLEQNSVRLTVNSADYEALIRRLAVGEVSKNDVAAFLRGQLTIEHA